MKNSLLGKNIDEVCGAPPGAFERFVKEKEAYLEALEKERKDRIRASQKGNQELALAA
ncbi:MAG: hypothetical protein ABSG78_02750 [Verrucomicrobiota bacterium]|jgi:hypothetical protein